MKNMIVIRPATGHGLKHVQFQPQKHTCALGGLETKHGKKLGSIIRAYSEPETLSEIAAALDLRGEDGTLPGLPPMWQFTNVAPGKAQGATFYMPAGSSHEACVKRWQAKRAEFER